MNNAFFLTESISLRTDQLIQRGIDLGKDRREFQYEGEYTARKHLAWIEDCQKKYQERRMFSAIPETLLQ